LTATGLKIEALPVGVAIDVVAAPDAVELEAEGLGQTLDQGTSFEYTAFATNGIGDGPIASIAESAQPRSTAPPYSHSYYVTEYKHPNGELAYDKIRFLGVQDGERDSALCRGTGRSERRLTILNFGHVLNLRGPGTPYQGYGTLLLDFDQTVKISFEDVVFFAQQYVYGYYIGSARETCNQLLVALGTNSNNQCAGSDFPCDRYQAGRAWGDMVTVMARFLRAQDPIGNPRNIRFDAQVDVAAADNIETNGQAQGYECAGEAIALINGFGDNNPLLTGYFYY
jgi:hypothetical protein